MISRREIEKIRRVMRGLEFYNIETDILSDLLDTYEKAHPEARPMQIVDKAERDQKGKEGE